ncbi:hypothetical protein MAM1_0195c07745 [Mucor ambiguus]|uniref:Small EDRK-rich factor-like N-terminal domain-containing protein n=1 Tax=Mucor ambiguus TaxID=91626 RepID=A0A0C9N100_9FUNG|nr:hypothetical protein MAM1_0195c07745 [Mucor ambiguus]
MARGNQREQARAKNLKKKEKEQKGKSNLNGQSINQKKESDAAIMRAKQEAALAKKQAEAATGASTKFRAKITSGWDFELDHLHIVSSCSLKFSVCLAEKWSNVQHLKLKYQRQRQDLYMTKNTYRTAKVYDINYPIWQNSMRSRRDEAFRNVLAERAHSKDLRFMVIVK